MLRYCDELRGIDVTSAGLYKNELFPIMFSYPVVTSQRAIRYPVWRLTMRHRSNVMTSLPGCWTRNWQSVWHVLSSATRSQSFYSLTPIEPSESIGRLDTWRMLCMTHARLDWSQSGWRHKCWINSNCIELWNELSRGRAAARGGAGYKMVDRGPVAKC